MVRLEFYVAKEPKHITGGPLSFFFFKFFLSCLSLGEEGSATKLRQGQETQTACCISQAVT